MSYEDPKKNYFPHLVGDVDKKCNFTTILATIIKFFRPDALERYIKFSTFNTFKNELETLNI